MPVAHSPLRYPGGKQILAKVLAHLIQTNSVNDCVYVEPYAGGAGAALSLMYAGYVGRIMINDADPCIFSFWKAILDTTEAFLRLLNTTPLTLAEWERQRRIYQTPRRKSTLRLGFATFYLNRCNRSGIIASGGPIGGKKQRGTWRLDARFNRDELCRRIEKIAYHKDRIAVFNLDAIHFLKRHVEKSPVADTAFVYLDPPYFSKGRELYLNSYDSVGHERLSTYLKGQPAFRWVMSYDNVPEVKALYSRMRQFRFNLSYSARERTLGRELFIVKDGLVFPERWRARIPQRYISAANSVAIPIHG